jgi:hypothetical protein
MSPAFLGNYVTGRRQFTKVKIDIWLSGCPTGQVKKSEIPKRAGTMDKSISTGIKYWVCCIKEPCLISEFVHNLF